MQVEDSVWGYRWDVPEGQAGGEYTVKVSYPFDGQPPAERKFDILGLTRENTDAIKNIATLGINTFGWAFKVRGVAVPEQPPKVELALPSGNIETWFDSNEADSISGTAEAFCQVVTQVRNIDDTDLQVDGPVAREWMSNAQCFAGPPESPPAAGTRYRCVRQRG